MTHLINSKLQANASLILNNFTLTLPEAKGLPINHIFRGGRVNYICGPSGIGKSTLLSTLSLLRNQRIDHGQIALSIPKSGNTNEISKFDYSNLSSRDKYLLRKQHFGICTQSSMLIKDLSCLNNIFLSCTLSGKIADVEEITKYFDELFSPEDRLKQRVFNEKCMPTEISVGQNQRIALIAAIARKPDFLFLDEPTSNLDQESKSKTTGFLKRWVENDPGKCAIVVSHDQTSNKNDGELRLE